MIAKDFQEATANRIVDLFMAGHNRVLLADEVGLGKTIVAKTVVEKTGKWRKEENDPDYVVVYICSNAGIADQNCSKLGIAKENRVSISEGRLSMQHLMLAESKKNGNVKLIPMTPATSFQIRSGAGTAPERALAYLLMVESHICNTYSAELSLLMRTYFISKETSWEDYIECQSRRINQLEHKKKYLKNMKDLLEQNFKPELIAKIKSACRKIRKQRDDVGDDARLDKIISWEDQKGLINIIRYCLAEISLGMLEPDLVIMDEFQRFKDLIEIDDNDHSDEAMLSRKFLHDNTNSCVLLLSATPYKPYSTLTELTEGEETHLKGFMRVMDFLINGEEENQRFHTVWESYSAHLSEIRGNDLSVLITSKKEAEQELYNHMCRTERRDSGIINTVKACPMPLRKLSPANVNSYIELQNLMQDMGIGSFPIEYVKSAPFLMSFMNYKVKNKIDDFLKGNKYSITPEERAKYIKRISTAFLKRSLINGYQPLPDTNARLNTLFDEVFGNRDNKKASPELLLWIPPANKYYTVGPRCIFEQCEGYSKTLVFSSWEMVPRVIATLTSYEAERLVNQRRGNKSAEQKSYYAVPDEDDLDDGENPKKKKSGKTRFLIKEQRELVAYPSVWLAGKYDYKKYYGFNLATIKKEIKKEIVKEISALSKKLPVPQAHLGAKQLLEFLKYMDDQILETNDEIIPKQLPSGADIDTLVNIAIGSPAVCLFRALSEIESVTDRMETARECCDKSFVSMFNRPEARSIMDAVFKGTKRLSGDRRYDHYKQVFHYCVDGNFQSMLDEYKYALGVGAEEFVEAVENSFLKTTNLPYVSQEYYKVWLKDPSSPEPKLRVHFAAGYFDAKTSDKSIQRVNNVRNAFNSPFRPFVLATTSVGQEGLDFHLYSRKVVHWNLPNNPIDLEQREGRINRYMCHAIRQNVAANEEGCDWTNKFEQTRLKYGQNSSEMIPYWCLPDDYPYKYQIERIVPMYPFSQDMAKYDRLINVLALYRLTLGHPRQEEMISILQQEVLTKEQMEELFFDLSPYSRNIKGCVLRK
ncbi:MAG: hypothetical protein J1D87_02785 [Lachnospiraceae bacterium]|nr:hypothetical protein [Lachnospiraceae bacterium]